MRVYKTAEHTGWEVAQKSQEVIDKRQTPVVTPAYHTAVNRMLRNAGSGNADIPAWHKLHMYVASANLRFHLHADTTTCSAATVDS